LKIDESFPFNIHKGNGKYGENMNWFLMFERAFNLFDLIVFWFLISNISATTFQNKKYQIFTIMFMVHGISFISTTITREWSISYLFYTNRNECAGGKFLFGKTAKTHTNWKGKLVQTFSAAWILIQFTRTIMPSINIIIIIINYANYLMSLTISNKFNWIMSA
jgi:hypothetical protein